MQTVFLLQHLHVREDDSEDVKTIGVFSTRELAVAAVERLHAQPGFRDHPRIVNPDEEESASVSGFYIDRCRLDHLSWLEGFDTIWT